MIHLWTSVRQMRTCARRRLALVVDSDHEFRRFAMRGLLRAGCASVGFGWADEALRWIADGTETPILIALDARLERGDGVELCTAIRSSARVANVPILCASSLVDVDDRLRVMRAGADVFLTKPVRPDVFLDAAAGLLRAGSHARLAGTTFIDARRM
jgi:DNA-binding response OmpR family regulator